MNKELDAALQKDFPIGAEHDNPGIKEQLLAESKNPVMALRKLADLEESGEEMATKRAVVVIQREDGTLGVVGYGPEANDLSLIALLSLGLQQIQSEMLY